MVTYHRWSLTQRLADQNNRLQVLRVEILKNLLQDLCGTLYRELLVFKAIFWHLLACFGNSFFLSNFFNFWQCMTTIIFTMLPCNNVNAFVIVAAPPNLYWKSSGCTSKEDILLHKQSQSTSCCSSAWACYFVILVSFCMEHYGKIVNTKNSQSIKLLSCLYNTKSCKVLVRYFFLLLVLTATGFLGGLLFSDTDVDDQDH